jgi:fructose-1,6-bisphosphatase/inositol monophosphatase family enzyme
VLAIEVPSAGDLPALFQRVNGAFPGLTYYNADIAPSLHYAAAFGVFPLGRLSVSEEAGHIYRGGDRVLVVDPVDGSHNALRGLPFSTISLAVGRSTLAGIDVGVVHDLATGTTYWAERGSGAFRDGQRIRTRKWDARTELFFVNLGRHSTERAAVLAATGRRIRALGCASLEMSLVAQGGADAYFFDNDVEERNLRVTDIAAGYRILTEAGGGVSDGQGRSVDSLPLTPGPRTSVLAWGDPVLVDELTHRRAR